MTGLFKLHIPTNRDLEPPLQLPRLGASSTTAETWSLLCSCRDLEPPLQLSRPGASYNCRDLEPPLQLPRPGASSTTAKTWSLLYNCRDLEPPLQLPRPGASSTTAGPRSAVGSASDSSEVLVSIPVWPHTFVSPSADSRGAVVSYWRKYVH